MVRDWLLSDADQQGDDYYGRILRRRKGISLEEALRELYNWQDITLPPQLPKTPGRMMPVLRRRFKDNVTFISLILNHHFPDKYLFYRVSTLEKEIFAGLKFLREAVPEFAFDFPKIGRAGFRRYLQLNDTLLDFADKGWHGDGNRQRKLHYFLYQGLGRLFRENSGYSQYWVMATQEKYFDALDSGEDVDWSGRKEMQPGNLVFIYRMTPRKAVTDLYRVKAKPDFDPWAEWGGFVVPMEKICAIDDVPFGEMKKDDIFGQWGIVRRHFVGTVTEPVPPIVYNELLKRLPPEVQAKYKLKPEEIASLKPSWLSGTTKPKPSQLPTLPTPELSGRFSSEVDFEEKAIAPLLKRWGFKYRSQHVCPAWVGSQEHELSVDFLISDDQGPLTLFEDKLRIMSDKELEPAVGQAKSYALLLGLPSFVVASPEGMWLYALDGNRERLVEQISAIKVRSQQEREFRDLLLELRQ
jgi:hypothetical protein